MHRLAVALLLALAWPGFPTMGETLTLARGPRRTTSLPPAAPWAPAERWGAPEAAALAFHQPAQRVDLAWKLQTGTQLVYRVSVQSERRLGTDTATMHLETTQRWSVLEVDGDANATVRLTTERIRITLVEPMGTTTVDSADETRSGTLLGAFTAVAGTSYSVVLHPRGALTGMSGVEEMHRALRTRIPDPSGRYLVGQMLSEELLRRRWELAVFSLPPEAVGVGSTWHHALTPPLSPARRVEVTQEVESIEQDIVIVSAAGTLPLRDRARLGETTVVQTSRFDARRGLLLRGEGTVAVQIPTATDDQDTLNGVYTVTLELIEE